MLLAKAMNEHLVGLPLRKPWKVYELRINVMAGLEAHKQRVEEDYSTGPAWICPQAEDSEPLIVTDDADMKQLLVRLPGFARTGEAVLIAGQEGTGKKRFARHIHALRWGWQTPWLAVQCRRVPAHVQSFQAREVLPKTVGGMIRKWTSGIDGALLLAEGGTLVLEDIEDLRRDLQVGLAEMLNSVGVPFEGGGHKVVATTEGDPEELMAEGRLLPELYETLQVEMHLPSLRERPGDIPILLDYFLRRFRDRAGRPGLCFTPEAVQCVVDAPLPGNVRQLRSLVSMVVSSVEHDVVTAEDVAPLLRQSLLSPH